MFKMRVFFFICVCPPKKTFAPPQTILRRYSGDGFPVSSIKYYSFFYFLFFLPLGVIVVTSLFWHEAVLVVLSAPGSAAWLLMSGKETALLSTSPLRLLIKHRIDFKILLFVFKGFPCWLLDIPGLCYNKAGQKADMQQRSEVTTRRIFSHTNTRDVQSFAAQWGFKRTAPTALMKWDGK